MIPSGYHDIPAGHLAAVVTFLEMKAPPAPRPDPPGSEQFRFAPMSERSVAAYRSLFSAVGADWLWTSRMVMPDEKLQAILSDPRVTLHELTTPNGGRGLLELDFRNPGQCELVFFGVTRNIVGTGAGRYLMNRAIALAFAQPIERFWLHTCTLDHPGAIAFYQRSGFHAFKRQVEVLPDPRLTGHLPRDAAPHIPVIDD
ncbi:MAG: GNAT family N-acetyltransferase [Beijerinckiaceae bacterium]